ncbi:MAG: glycosyltransferase family 4 protein [Elusimicrobia bacterium]|nr:glycosyltransferase family 4 protein [Elusimicrobiota bacterium]
MNIAIDARTISNNKTGIGNYIKNICEKLPIIDKNNIYIYYQEKLRHSLKNIPIVSVISRVLYFLYDNLVFPFQLTLQKIDLYHNPAFMLPLVNFGYKKIITVNDLGFYTFGHDFAKGWHARHMKMMLPLSIKRADKIVAISQATKNQVIDLFQVAPDKIVVTYLGVSEKYRVIPSQIEVKEVLHKYRIEKPYILFVGTMDPRKNLVRLIKAFQNVKRQKNDLKLVIVGNKGELFSIELDKMVDSGDIILTGYIGEEELVYLYNGASIFTFPSLYEGFGLPILEAMACGTPVITSNVYSMPEVAGEAAILVNPESTDEISAAINRLLQDEPFRKSLIEKGLRRVREFTWEKTAQSTLAVYKEVMGPMGNKEERLE